MLRGQAHIVVLGKSLVLQPTGALVKPVDSQQGPARDAVKQGPARETGRQGPAREAGRRMWPCSEAPVDGCRVTGSVLRPRLCFQSLLLGPKPGNQERLAREQRERSRIPAWKCNSLP